MGIKETDDKCIETEGIVKQQGFDTPPAEENSYGSVLGAAAFCVLKNDGEVERFLL